MANTDYTYDEVLAGKGQFKKDTSHVSMSVKRMQMKLYRLQYSIGEPDGIFGSNTEQALKDFQTVHALPVTGIAKSADLKELDKAKADSTDELYGRELTAAELTGGYSNANISSIESLARCIYGEDPKNSDGQNAVAKELYNRMHSVRNFQQLSNTWKGYVFGPDQYAVMTSSGAALKDSRSPDPYSSSWANCVALAKLLVAGKQPSSKLGKQCFHIANGYAYPSNAVASTRIQIPTNKGNKFYDTMENPN